MIYAHTFSLTETSPTTPPSLDGQATTGPEIDTKATTGTKRSPATFESLRLTEPSATLMTTTEDPTTSILPLNDINSALPSCSVLSQGSPSGEYWIRNNDQDANLMYCDMTRTCCNTTGGWTRIVNLDMTDPNQECPGGFRLVTRTTEPLRTCGRPETGGCVSAIARLNGIEYSQVCGRVIAYQFGTPDAFDNYYRNPLLTIDGSYFDGISLTHGQSPRQHIWTFANAVDEAESEGDQLSCPCIEPEDTFTGNIPPFIGQDYFCDTGSNTPATQIVYSNDPLWDGQGCGDDSTCCSFNNPPWFCKQLPLPTTDNIELRLCLNDGIDTEDVQLELVDIYVH